MTQVTDTYVTCVICLWQHHYHKHLPAVTNWLRMLLTMRMLLAWYGIRTFSPWIPPWLCHYSDVKKYANHFSVRVRVRNGASEIFTSNYERTNERMNGRSLFANERSEQWWLPTSTGRSPLKLATKKEKKHQTNKTRKTEKEREKYIVIRKIAKEKYKKNYYIIVLVCQGEVSPTKRPGKIPNARLIRSYRGSCT